ncbi:hypothetical protein GCM10007067_30460 [Lysobacter bugurensis]|uniref:Uncharacterized protein n=1 Tax=Cognatilysobacter bugurensis TaxID=543356 RepID=A0A918T477_9GAMM|nr:hypothetical protein GCM10007067_30460 [Lysobacter bugurensis]
MLTRFRRYRKPADANVPGMGSVPMLRRRSSAAPHDCSATAGPGALLRRALANDHPRPEPLRESPIEDPGAYVQVSG